MKQSVNSLLVKHSSLQQLVSAGFLYLDELEEISPVELSQEAKLSLEESLQVIDEVRRHKGINPCSLPPPTPDISTEETHMATKTVPQSMSSLELFWREQESSGIPTGSREIDEMLGAGIPLCKMTELCGVPGIGKSQLAFQLCINATLHDENNLKGAEAVLIDTEGSFVVQRVKQMAEAVCNRMSPCGVREGVEQREVTSDSILSRIHYFRCLDVIQLISVVNTLDEFISDRRKERQHVKLVMIDSIAFPFRMEVQDLKVRSRILQTMSQTLMEITHKFGLAVVLTNQMTSRPAGKDQAGRLQRVPALGESWSHIPTIRVILEWTGSIRTARLAKSPTHMEKVVPYEITEAGVSDLLERRVGKREFKGESQLSSKIIKY